MRNRVKGTFMIVNLKRILAKLIHHTTLFICRWEYIDRKIEITVDGLIKVLRTFKKELEDGRILIHVGDDRQLLATFPDQYFDWIYIDSSHTYKHTKQELQILTSRVKDNGIIAGDDWRPEPSHYHHGVYKAVNEFIVTKKYRLVYSNRDNRQWAIKKS